MPSPAQKREDTMNDPRALLASAGYTAPRSTYGHGSGLANPPCTSCGGKREPHLRASAICERCLRAEFAADGLPLEELDGKLAEIRASHGKC